MHRMVLLPARGETTAVIVPVREGEYLVGRSSNCDIVINDASVSRRHARLIINGNELRISDLQSRFGTFVNDQRIESCVVQAGHVIRFGGAPYHLVLATDALLESALPDEEVETRRPPVREILDTIENLRPSQRRVFDLMRDGASEPEIAARLNLSVHTVHSHVKAIYSHFNVHSRAELIARTVRKD